MEVIDKRKLIAAICRKADGVSEHIYDVDLAKLFAMDAHTILQCIVEAPLIEYHASEAMTIERTRRGRMTVQCGDCNADITDGVLHKAIKFCPYCGSHLNY